MTTKIGRKKAKESTAAAYTERCERAIEENKAEIDALQKRVWATQDPQMQLQKKAARSQRLNKWQPELVEKIRKAQEEQQAAIELAGKHEAEATKLSDLFKKNAAEIAQLNAESHSVLKAVGQQEDVGQFVEKDHQRRNQSVR